MKILTTTIEFYNDASNKRVMQFQVEDGSFWTRDEKGKYKQVVPSYDAVQEEFHTHIKYQPPVKPEREHWHKEE